MLILLFISWVRFFEMFRFNLVLSNWWVIWLFVWVKVLNNFCCVCGLILIFVFCILKCSMWC